MLLMAYAIPGFVFVKIKAFGQESIGAFVKVLLFVCQPFLTLYSFNSADYSPRLLTAMLIFLVLAILLQSGMMGLAYLFYKRKYAKDASYRVCTIATTLGNIGFIGVPLIEALLPEHPEAVIFSAMFVISMNLIGWTISSTVLTGDRKYMSLKRLALNPVTLAIIIAVPLFLTGTKLPPLLENSVALLGKMTTPLSMMILGMRLALTKFRFLFKDYKIYMVAIFKLLAFPLLGLASVWFLPIDHFVKITMVILCCCPTASFVLNLSELYDTGQKTAANVVLTSNIFCIFTIPFIMLLVNSG